MQEEISKDRAMRVITEAMLAWSQAGNVNLLDVKPLMYTVLRNAPYMTSLEWQQRSARWNAKLSDERRLGRLEGMLMSAEMYLHRLTGLGMSRERCIELLADDIRMLERATQLDEDTKGSNKSEDEH